MAPAEDIRIRPARLDEREALDALIARSARALSAGWYEPAQVEACLGSAFGVDTELIEDGSYLVAECDGTLAGCGGWSRRPTLFGADGRPDRLKGELDPAADAAKIRAFFVDPAFARRGVGRAIYQACETAARAHGFKAFELMATLPGVPLYEALGFVGSAPVDHDLGGGVSIRFLPMRKDLA
jgi:GNAT superfamily N-acetyltransferase